MARPFYVVITERDTADAYDRHLSGGAIVHETYTRDAYLGNAIQRAKSLGNAYGEVWIGKVSVVTIEEAETLMRGDKHD